MRLLAFRKRLNDTILERKEEQGTTQYPADADG
jgi:hypothetical protein